MKGIGISRGVPVARLKPTNLRVMLCHPGIHLSLRPPQENIPENFLKNRSFLLTKSMIKITVIRREYCWID